MNYNELDRGKAIHEKGTQNKKGNGHSPRRVQFTTFAFTDSLPLSPLLILQRGSISIRFVESKFQLTAELTETTCMTEWTLPVEVSQQLLARTEKN